MPESTLRAGLLTRLAPMLALLLLLDAAACYYTAVHFANVVYDQWLADSARSLSRALVATGGEVDFDLPAVGREVFQFDEVDRTWFRVTAARRGELAGDPALPAAPPASAGRTAFADAIVGGDDVRVASIVVTPGDLAEPVTISVAETTRKRGRLTVEILLAMAAPQVGLLLFAAGFAWYGVSRGLKPLTDLAGMIESRGDRDLRPLPDADVPREARVLVREINELLGRLGRSLEANRRFLATAAHQLRTPLAAVVLHAEQAERAPDLPAARQALATLHRAVGRAVRLTAQLLAVARAEPEAADAAPLQPTDLAELARQIGEEAVPQALARRVDLGLAVPDRPVTVTGNAGLLADAISNLVDNALRHSPEGGRVTIVVEPRDGGARLLVEDEGSGIPPAERERVLERFYRIAGSPGEGSGLGLAIVREIAHVHGARVSIGENREGRGCAVTLDFPAT